MAVEDDLAAAFEPMTTTIGFQFASRAGAPACGFVEIVHSIILKRHYHSTLRVAETPLAVAGDANQPW